MPYTPNIIEFTAKEERAMQYAEDAYWKFVGCEHEEQEIVPDEGTYCKDCSKQLDFRCPDFGRYSDPGIRRLMT